MILERDGWRCQLCGKAGALEAGHIVPLDSSGDPWPADNPANPRRIHKAKTKAERGDISFPHPRRLQIAEHG